MNRHLKAVGAILTLSAFFYGLVWLETTYTVWFFSAVFIGLGVLAYREVLSWFPKEEKSE